MALGGGGGEDVYLATNLTIQGVKKPNPISPRVNRVVNAVNFFTLRTIRLLAIE